jgi:hypothetical protein
LIDTEIATAVMAQQDLWRKRLADAETRYHEADGRLKDVTATGGRTDGVCAHKIAAREEYLRILRIFTDLVLRGKSPRSEE